MLMLPPEALVLSANRKLLPLPPEAVKPTLPRGATLTDGGLMVTAAPTATLAVALLPSESTTRTTSVTLPVAPAVYRPVDESIEPPEALVCSDQAKPLPEPPEAMNMTVPLGAAVAGEGTMTMPPPTETLVVATLPSESVRR